MQVMSIALPIESDAHKFKFSVEKELKKSVTLSELNCKLEMKSYESCELAKYKYQLSNSSLKALESFHSLLHILAYLTGILSVIGFISHPFIEQEMENQESS